MRTARRDIARQADLMCGQRAQSTKPGRSFFDPQRTAQVMSHAEVEFVHPVSPGGSVKFVASGVNFSIFTIFLCFFLLKLLKLGEIGGVKFLT